MKYLQTYGGIWKLTNANYKRYLNDVIDGKMWDLDDYGKHIFDITANVTDLEPINAVSLLDALERE